MPNPATSLATGAGNDIDRRPRRRTTSDLAGSDVVLTSLPDDDALAAVALEA